MNPYRRDSHPELLRRGTEALVGGRLRESERLAAEALRRRPREPAPALLGVAACREQGRFAEAELLLRGVMAEHPDLAEGQALLAAVLADLGRDADARRQLDALLDAYAGELPPAVAAPAAEAAAALRSADHGARLVDALAAHAPAGAGWYGSLARHLGLACHVAGRDGEAEAQFRVALRANASAGAPVLVAHTRRHYAVLLRARGVPGDWELATELLSGAAVIYRRLEIVPLADHAEAVLRRAQDGGAGAGVFRRTESGWEVGFAGRRAEIPAAGAGAGLDHIAQLLAAAGRPLYAVDLMHDGGDPAVEYRARIADLESHATTKDPLAAALARAECDVLAAELTTPTDDAGERARRLVTVRIRIALDHLDAALPELGHHLRRGIQTGTFCLYEPAQLERWSLGAR